MIVHHGCRNHATLQKQLSDNFPSALLSDDRIKLIWRQSNTQVLASSDQLFKKKLREEFHA